DVIAAVQHALGGVEEAEVVARVPGCVHREELEVADAYHATIRQRLRVLPPRRRVEAVHRRTGLPCKAQGKRAMVGVRVREQDRVDVTTPGSGRLEDGREVMVVVRPRVDAVQRRATGE